MLRISEVQDCPTDPDGKKNRLHLTDADDFSEKHFKNFI